MDDYGIARSAGHATCCNTIEPTRRASHKSQFAALGATRAPGLDLDRASFRDLEPCNSELNSDESPFLTTVGALHTRSQG